MINNTTEQVFHFLYLGYDITYNSDVDAETARFNSVSDAI